MSMVPERPVRQRGLVVLSKAEQLINYLMPHINKIPRYQRYRFATRLEDNLWLLVRCLIEAAMSGQKSKVYRADEQVRYLHALLRFAAENQLIRPKHIGAASQQLSEIGAMIGAWRKKLHC